MQRIEISRLWRFAVFVLLSLAVGCGGGNMSSSTPPSSLTLSLANNTALVFQGQTTSVTVNATLLRGGTTGNVTLTVSGLATGATAQIQPPGNANSGSISFTAGTAAAGNYLITLTARHGT